MPSDPIVTPLTTEGRFSSLAAEALVADTGEFRVSSIVCEALIAGTAPPSLPAQQAVTVNT